MPETFVLINGAWHGGWAWRPVARHLRAAGHRVLTPTLPGLHDGDDPTDLHLSDVVDAVVDLVEREDLRDVTLVGHSWGGYPMTGAAHHLRTRLRKLVYWSAFVPARGRSLHDEIPPGYQELFADLARASDDNTVALPLDVWQAAFVHDAPEDVQRALHELMVPHPYQYFTETVEPLDAAAGIPVAYVLSREDIALPPGEYGWDRFAERLGVEPLVAPGSHEACFTAPEGLAHALLKA
ncbi:pimeloyl-ACP methyl ester carboxylesterase [Pseudonocardia hierapolitana]|uniref:Pimeloyl-ACP methyl ester carboxylesterase n=1 Tax=Pseudonocardia hierapolitana TaxID=1128676 RepID=A0A561SZQ4_9PSEU|nr:alpha/beta hydrolase [Pseudonocardia hierapolitana]TWF80342.1 pimeloyl-ACP methyl ester carboxylesterase [Pseudonocardia hierapolitana]